MAPQYLPLIGQDHETDWLWGLRLIIKINLCTKAVFLDISATAALTIRNCINGQVEVYEDDGTVVTCSDIANPSDVVWRRGVGGEAIGECKADGTCSPVYLYHDYALSRAPYSSDSRLTILRDYRANGGLEVTCQQMGSTSSARCKLVIKRMSWFFMLSNHFIFLDISAFKPSHYFFLSFGFLVSLLYFLNFFCH